MIISNGITHRMIFFFVIFQPNNHAHSLKTPFCIFSIFWYDKKCLDIEKGIVHEWDDGGGGGEERGCGDCGGYEALAETASHTEPFYAT